MKIVVIGAAGAIGTAVVEELGQRHDIVTVGRSSGQYQVDIADYAQVQSLFQDIGGFDGVVVAAGQLQLAPLTEITPAQFRVGVDSKLMGQIHVALAAQPHLSEGGSITLTSGIARQIRDGAAAATVNAALEGFVEGAASGLRRGQRINIVNPTVLEESLPLYGPYFIGFEPAKASRVALAYARSVDGVQSGQVYKVW